MEWDEWIDKIVFIKLDDGRVFSFSKVITYDKPFISFTDRDNLPVVLNVKNIAVIKEEKKEDAK